MKKLFSIFAALLLVFSALIIPQPQSVAAAPEATPVMTYIRFNRYGGDIYVNYCIASANSYNLNWGALAPTYWSTWANYGAINNCTNKYLFSQVASGETLQVYFEAFGSSTSTYQFYLYPQGNANLSCSIGWAATPLNPDGRITSPTACAFIQ